MPCSSYPAEFDSEETLEGVSFPPIGRAQPLRGLGPHQTDQRPGQRFECDECSE